MSLLVAFAVARGFWWTRFPPPPKQIVVDLTPFLKWMWAMEHQAPRAPLRDHEWELAL